MFNLSNLSTKINILHKKNGAEIVINFIGNNIYTYFQFIFQRQDEFTSLKFQRWN